MQRKFMYILLIIFMICVVSVDAGEEKRIRFEDSAIQFWRGSREFCKITREGFEREESEQEKKGVLMSDGWTRIRINKDENVLMSDGVIRVRITGEGKLTFYNDTIGYDKEQRHVVVRSPSGKIIFDSEQRRDMGAVSPEEEYGDEKMQLGDMSVVSPEEENGDEEMQLEDGSRITVGSCFDTSRSITVTYSSLKKLISKKDGSEHFVLSSTWNLSQLVSVATRSYDIGGATDGNCFGRSGRNEVLLDATEGEIRLLDDFLEFDKEGGRKKLLTKLPINKYAGLLVNLHKHDFTKNGCSYFDYARPLLEKKVYDSLEQATSLDMSCWHSKIDWFKKINIKSSGIMEDVLRQVIRPVPKALFRWSATDDVNLVNFSSDAMMVLLDCGGGRREIRDLKNGEVLFAWDNVVWMNLNSLGTRVAVLYEGGKGEIIDLEYGRVLFEKHGIKRMYSNSAGTKISAILHISDGYIREQITIRNFEGNISLKMETVRGCFQDTDSDPLDNPRLKLIWTSSEYLVRDCKYKKFLFEVGRMSVSDIILNSTNMLAIVYYCSGKVKIIDLKVENDENKRVLFEGDNISDIRLNPTGTWAVVEYKDNRKELRSLENGWVIFEGYNIVKIDSNLTGTRVAVQYKDNRIETIDLEEDYNRDIIFTELKPEELLFIFSLKNLNFPNADNLMACRSLWKSLSFDLKGKLQKSYLSEKVVAFLRGKVAMIILAVIERKKFITQIFALSLFFSVIYYKIKS